MVLNTNIHQQQQIRLAIWQEATCICVPARLLAVEEIMKAVVTKH